MCVRVYALDLTQSVRYPIHHFSYALICYPNDERYVNLTANTSHSTTYLYVSMCEQFLPFLKFLREVKYCLNFNLQGFHKSCKIPLGKFDEFKYYLGPNMKISNPVLN